MMLVFNVDFYKLILSYCVCSVPWCSFIFKMYVHYHGATGPLLLGTILFFILRSGAPFIPAEGLYVFTL